MANEDGGNGEDGATREASARPSARARCRRGYHSTARASEGFSHMIARISSSPSPRILRFALLVLAVYIIDGLMLASGRLAQRPELGGAAVTFDLVVAIPF